MEQKKVKRLVLGEGEAIGHKHVLESASGMDYRKTNAHLRIWLKDMGILTHDEHDRMVFESGATLRSYNQVELNPMDNSIDSVFD